MHADGAGEADDLEVSVGPAPLELVGESEEKVDDEEEFYPVETSRFHLLPPGISRVDYQADAAFQAREALRKELGCPADAIVALHEPRVTVRGLRQPDSDVGVDASTKPGGPPGSPERISNVGCRIPGS